MTTSLHQNVNLKLVYASEPDEHTRKLPNVGSDQNLLGLHPRPAFSCVTGRRQFY